MQILSLISNLLNQTFWSEAQQSVLASTPGNSDAHWHLRTIDLNYRKWAGRSVFTPCRVMDGLSLKAWHALGRITFICYGKSFKNNVIYKPITKLEKVESVKKSAQNSEISIYAPLTGAPMTSNLSVHLLSGFDMPPVIIWCGGSNWARGRRLDGSPGLNKIQQDKGWVDSGWQISSFGKENELTENTWMFNTSQL